MSDEEIQSSPERAFARSHHWSEEYSPTNNPTADAFLLFSKHLDNALEKQKKEIFTVFEAKIPALNEPASKADFKFKFVSNKKQCEFNDQVSKDIDILKAAISSDNRDFALKTNKILLLATKLSRLVTNMVGTPLASMKAETRAIRKRKTVAHNDTSKKFAADKLFRGFSKTPETRSYTNSAQITPRYNGPRSSTANFRARKGSSPQDICYYCGATGHWSSNCPEKANKSNNTSSSK
ncbi:unnamed protein product [Mytilus coruscus]|uniref:CCHC-type domain-containing protein n=1 Tax=Mytilus coruscus TaxID=42192 RepID=A0A6J8DU82_MYTCO|nr:unnamed protein product [Mytilus coruscus]